MDNNMNDAPETKPKVVSRRAGPRANTAKPSSKIRRLHMQLAGIEAHLKTHPNDTLSQARVAKINQLLRS